MKHGRPCFVNFARFLTNFAKADFACERYDILNTVDRKSGQRRCMDWQRSA